MTRPGLPHEGFRGLIDHLPTLIRNQFRFSGSRVTVPVLTGPGSAAGSLPPAVRPYPALARSRQNATRSLGNDQVSPESRAGLGTSG
jgi:hypothetical protein